VADRLGRSRGRLAVLDRIHPPIKAPLKPDLANWNKHELAAAWIGHATILLRVGGTTILTDPVFSSRVGIGLGLITAGPKRLVAPAVSLRELPNIDLILISHAHFDHLDRPTLARIARHIPVITARHTGDLLKDLGFRNVRELHWGESLDASPSVRISAHSVAHWGARTFHDRHRGFNSYLIEGNGRRVLYGADTAYHEGFKSLAPVDLAILGIGAYNPYIAAHANPEQAWEMAQHCRARWILPMHHSTFRLSYEPTGEPIKRMLAAAGSEAEKIVVRQVGGQWSLD
jgi:L-ascorbate metabolism protein UlaG (beta-lactamase superfamily)